MTLHDLEGRAPGLAAPGATSDDPDRRPQALVRRDQLEAVRRSVLTAIPVNMLLGLASVLVAFQAGNGRAGLIWYAASTGANLLRIGLYEILHDPDIPTAVAINEAVDLAKELSTDDSGRFVNGLLARVAEDSG